MPPVTVTTVEGGEVEKLAKRNPLSKKARALLAEWFIDVEVGEFVIEDHYGSLYRVKAITKDGIEIEHEWTDDETGKTEWHHYSLVEYKNFKDKYAVLKMPLEDLEKLAQQCIANPQLLDEFKEEVQADSTALVVSQGKTPLIEMRKKMEASINKVKCVESLVRNKVDQIRDIVHRQEKSLEKVVKVLHALELYLGIGEQVVQFKEGEPAPELTPITFRQQILYMDEEAGLIDEEGVDNQGIDYQDVGKFDEWLLKPGHLEIILPQPKGVVILKVRRHDRRYDGDPWSNAAANAKNAQTYILIRNGENLYRVYADLIIQPRLFPVEGELLALLKDDSWRSQEELEERDFTYKKNALLLQGLLTRTTIFQPLPHPLDLFRPDTWDNLLNFVHDDEYDKLLTDGRPRYKDWHKLINSKIEQGSRVVFGGIKGYRWQPDRNGGGESSYHVPYQYRYCSPPARGVYEVKGKGIVESRAFRFIFNPGDDIWRRYGHHERMKGISYSFDRDDSNILNYDQMELADINYYINNRLERPDYLDILPVLKTIRRELKEEQAREAEFVKLISGQLKVKIEKVLEAVAWWKFKNKWKRALAKDDAKAYRMIKRKLEGDEE